MAAEPSTATVAERNATGLYCYGVMSAEAAPTSGAGGIGGAAVESVREGKLAALTSRIGSTKVRATRRDLLRHSEVLLKALDRGTVLPLRFGVVFDSEEALLDDFLRPRHDELMGLLRDLEGRVELRVTAFYREEEILAEVVHANPRIAKLRAATRDADAAATYPFRLELGELVAAEVDARTRRDRQELLERLRPLSLAAEVEDEPIEHQVLRASFLVERRHLSEFDEAMDSLARRHAERIHFKYVGPLPPHSFVSLDGEGGR